MRNRLRPLLTVFIALALLVATAKHAEADETPAYIAIGDSIAFGIGATDPAAMGYAARTFEALRSSDRYRERGLELINLSAAGATSSDLLLPGGQLEAAVAEIERRQLDESSQDDDVEIITIDIGANDLLGLVATDSPCVSQAADDDQCLQRLRDVLRDLQGNMSDLLQTLREAAPEATITVVDLYNPYSGTGDIRETIADFGVAQVNAATDAAASDPELRVETASVYQLFLGRGNHWVAADGIHPNDSGHAVIAEVVLATIEDRPVAIPQELVKETPGPVAGRPNSEALNSDDGISWWLVGAIIAAFAAGVVVSSAYFVVRGRT